MNPKHRIIILQTNDRPTDEGSTTLTTHITGITASAQTDTIIPTNSDTDSNSPSLSLSFSASGSANTNGGPCECSGAPNCFHYVGVPLPNFMGRSVSLDCCCDLDRLAQTTITAVARRRVTVEPCNENPNCDCNDPDYHNWCGCPGFYEEYSGSGPATNYIRLDGTVTTGICPPVGGYTLAAFFNCGANPYISDSNFFPSSFDPNEVTGNYTITCNRFTLQFTWTHEGVDQTVTQQTYVDISWNMDAGACCI